MSISAIVDQLHDAGSSSGGNPKKLADQLATQILQVSGGLIAQTPSSKGSRLEAGDVVLWIPLQYRPEIATEAMSGWMEVITAKLKPEINLENPGFHMICKYE